MNTKLNQLKQHLFSRWGWLSFFFFLLLFIIVCYICLVYPFDRFINTILAIATILGGGGVGLLVFLFNKYKIDVKKGFETNVQLHTLRSEDNENKKIVFLDHAMEDRKFAEKIKSKLEKEQANLHIIFLNIIDIHILNNSFESSNIIITVYHQCPSTWISTRLKYYTKLSKGKTPKFIVLVTNEKNIPDSNLRSEIKIVKCSPKEIQKCYENLISSIENLISSI